MAKPDNSGRVVMTTLLLVIIFFLLKYLAKEATRFIPMHEYLMLAMIIFQMLQLMYFTHQSYKRLRKVRRGEVHYQMYVPPQYASMMVSFVLGFVCVGVVLLINPDSFSQQVGMIIVFITFFIPGIYCAFKVIKYGKAYIKITEEEFISYRSKDELRIVWQEVEWVDEVTKIMDQRRGYEKIGIVFKLLSGRQIEVNTWRWGFSQEDVTNLIQDIKEKILR